jgi:nucleotide-binding universal stress UspA family protein
MTRPAWQTGRDSTEETSMTVTQKDEAHRIVVGVDGSLSSVAALNWALRQAELTGAKLEAITTWERPMGPAIGMAPPSDFDPKADARKVLDAVIASAEPGHEHVSVDSNIVGGPAGMVLVDASRGADLLVVGSRGHGELVGFLLGSVSEHCVTHAHSPVLVVRDGEVPGVAT